LAARTCATSNRYAPAISQSFWRNPHYIF
jgi:hypothetical protein